MLQRVDSYRNQVNFAYWRTRCEAEQTDEATSARENIFQAVKEYENARLEQAKGHFEKGWELWAQIIDGYPALRDDLSSHDMRRWMELYLATLSHLGEELPADFKLQWLVDRMSQPEPRSQDFIPLEGSPDGQPAQGTPPTDQP
jgi:hypothetical protein